MHLNSFGKALLKFRANFFDTVPCNLLLQDKILKLNLRLARQQLTKPFFSNPLFDVPKP